MSYTYEYFWEACQRLKKAGFNPRNYLDIGASNCETSNIVKKIWPQCDILLIEANQEFENLYKNYGYKYIFKCLGKENSETIFYKTRKNNFSSGNSIYREMSEAYNDESVITEKIKIYKLDDIVDKKFDFIKLDTQGSELDIINGGLNTISSSKVVIAEISLEQYNIGGCLADEVIEKLKNLKFDMITPIENIYSINSTKIIQQSVLFIKK
jgi:FkbM family methyltransferase